MTMISRLLGYVRDMVIAVSFGATGATDAFFVAFRIPNMLRRMFAEGAFSQAFVPVFTEQREKGEHAEVKDLVDHVAGSLSLILAVITVVGVLAAPILILIFAPGFADEPDRQQLATQMLRLTFPYVLFISLTALAAGILNSFGKFAVPAFTPVFLNLALIAAALWLAPRMENPVTALAWGVFIAGIVQLLFQLPALKKLGLIPRLRLNRDHPGVKKVLKLMLPALFGSSVAQINLLINTIIASFLVAGSISWLYFSDRFVELPLALFGVAIGTVILPQLSSQHSNGSSKDFSHTLDWGLRVGAIVALPAMLGLIFLAGPILATLLQYKAFTAHDTQMAAISLAAYSLGLPAFV
ncbi:MAG TPA: murein biosynthesis integral membrane protein MurJ, partial [Chromatiales bacterium]|nr:murein biosynthesis integral membrane protein MurJ [Chromatiales bacterium]